MTEYNIQQGDFNQWLDTYEGERFHALFADPPYALLENAKRFSSPTAKPAKGKSFARVGKGFMGQKWDGFRDLPHYQAWVTEWASKLHKVLYPGALVVLFGGSRTFHRLAVGLEDAGLEIIEVMMWVYASGMPKSLNIGKAIKKRAGREGRVTITGERWLGHGTLLKPAYEPIIIARLPRNGLAFSQLAEAYQTGALNIDAARIPTDEKFSAGLSGIPTPSDSGWSRDWMKNPSNEQKDYALAKIEKAHQLGRYPSNVLLTHAPNCSESECSPGCPVRQMNEQSGESSSKPHGGRGNDTNRDMDFRFKAGESTYSDAGGAARFFYSGKAASWERFLPGYLQPSEKLNPDERAEMLKRLKAEDYKPKFGTKDIFDVGQIPLWFKYRMQPARATHPTVKPLDLTSYLAGLLLPPAGGDPRRLLIPFSGIGSEMIGAHLAGWDIIQGVELTPEYIPQALSRLGWWVKHPTYESAKAAYNAKKKAGRKVSDELTAEEKAGVRRIPLFNDEG